MALGSGIADRFKSKVHPVAQVKEETAGAGATEGFYKGSHTIQDLLHTSHFATVISTPIKSAADLLHHTLLGWVGLIAGVFGSAYFENLAHKTRSKDLLHQYRSEIATIENKNPETATVKDLKNVGEKNKSIGDELKRSKRYRNFSIAKMGIATTTAFFSVVGLIALSAAFPPLGFIASWASAGLFTAQGLGFVAIAGATSFGMLHAATTVIGKVGKKLFGFDKHSTTDHVHALDVHLKEGKEVSAEEVMGVFTSANPSLNANIKYNFGAEYDKLPYEKQHEAIFSYGRKLQIGNDPEKIVDVQDVTDALNDGKLNPRELTFFVHGQSTGTLSPQQRRDKTIADRKAFTERAQRYSENTSAIFSRESPTGWQHAEDQRKVTRAANDKMLAGVS